MSASSSPKRSPECSPDQFAEVLKQEGLKWFDLGLFLGASIPDLKEIEYHYKTSGVMRCLIELHVCLKKKVPKSLTWDVIAGVLRRLGNNALADFIHCKYKMCPVSSPNEDNLRAPITSDATRSSDPLQHTVVIKGVATIFGDLELLFNRFDSLVFKIGKSFKDPASNIDLDLMQMLLTRRFGLPPLPQNEATVGSVFHRLQEKCSVLMFRNLTFFVEHFLSGNNEALLEDLKELEVAVNNFKRSEKLATLVDRIKTHLNHDPHQSVQLKLREVWADFTIKQFEIMINEILGTLYGLASHITVRKGCICVSWSIPPSVDYAELLPEPLSLEFLQIIGVISLHIGYDIIYDVGEEGCQTLEASMLQAIQLKNTRAVELLLAVGCNLEVATYNGNHAVTNVVNIRERSVDDGSRGDGVNHVCVFGHNEHIEAIVDSNRKPECDSCKMKEKQVKQFYLQIDTLKKKSRDLCFENETFLLEKDAEIQILTGKLKQKVAGSATPPLLPLNYELIVDTCREPEGVVAQKRKDRDRILNVATHFVDWHIINKCIAKEGQCPPKSKIADTLQQKNKDLRSEIEALSLEYDTNKAMKGAEIKALREQLKEKDKLADALQQKNKSLCLDIEMLSSKYTNQLTTDAGIQELTEQPKEKEADHNKAFPVLMGDNEQLMDEFKPLKDAESQELAEQLNKKAKENNKATMRDDELPVKSKPLKDELQDKEKKSLSVSSCTAALPRQKLLGIGAEMKVKMFTRDSDGKQLTNGGSAVRASLTCKEECPVIDNGDGTYLVLVPRQHHLSITINGEHINDSPFAFPHSDSSRLKLEPSMISIRTPKYIAFSDNGDMFVTSSDHCIYVYDKSGNRKATIGSRGTGELQFQHPHGIDISNGIVYVAEYNGHRIHLLTTGGKFIRTFGERGFGIGQFNCPHDVKISPDGRMYIADLHNERVQVFNPDWTISHVIDRTNVPADFNRFTLDATSIAFDQSGDVYVTVTDSCSVTVFTPKGEFVRRYGGSEIGIPLGIAVDPSGYSLVTSRCNDTVSVYDPCGKLVHSIEGLRSPHGVSILPDGSVWVADTINGRLVNY